MPAWVSTPLAFLAKRLPSFAFPGASLLLNGWVLGSLLAAAVGGYLFDSGRRYERRSQAAAVVDLNHRLQQMELADAKAEVQFQEKIEQAVIDAKASILDWKSNIQTAPLVKGDCTLDDGSIRKIRSIVGGGQ